MVAVLPPSGSGGGSSTLAGLTDVTGGPPATGEAPVWDGDSFEYTDIATQTELAALSSVYQPLDSDLTAIAALTTTSFGRALLALADAAAGRTAFGLGTASTSASTDFQPIDSDLTAIAALTTTSYGRSLLAAADAAALRTLAGTVIGTDVEAHDADLTTIAGLTPTNDDVLQRKAGAWVNRTIAQLKTDLSLSGTNTGDQTSVSGNAGTATALATARAIDGQNFDGTAAITVIAPGTHAATGKTTPVDADELPVVDSAASNVLKKVTWANLKATLKTYFDTLYAPVGGTSAMVQLSRTVLAVDTASFDISGISGSYNHLKVVVMGRHDTAGGATILQMRLNNDSAGNYDYNNMAGATGVSGTQAQAATAARIGAVPGSGEVSGGVAITELTIFDYALTTFHKGWAGSGGRKDSAAANGQIWEYPFGEWRSTAAVNRVGISLSNGSAKFLAGSTLTIYGIL